MPFFQPIAGCDPANTNATVEISADAPTRALRVFNVNDPTGALASNTVYGNTSFAFTSTGDVYMTRITVPNETDKLFGFDFQIDGPPKLADESNLEIRFYEGGTRNNSGLTVRTFYNRNRNASNTTNVTIRSGDVGSDNVSGETELVDWRSYVRDTGTVFDAVGWILAPNETYWVIVEPNVEDAYISVTCILKEIPI